MAGQAKGAQAVSDGPAYSVTRRGGRVYQVPAEVGYDAETVPSVTTVLKQVASPQLERWSRGKCAELAIASAADGRLQAWLGQGEDVARRHIADAPFTERDTAGSVGSAVHKYLEAYLRGEELPQLIGPHLDAAQHAIAAFSDLGITPGADGMLTEATCWGQIDGMPYAGALDLMATATIGGRQRHVLADVKTIRTTAGMRGWAAQIAAYRSAEYVVLGDGSIGPMPATDGGIVLHVRPTGTSVYALKPAEESGALDYFRSALQLHTLRNAEMHSPNPFITTSEEDNA